METIRPPNASAAYYVVACSRDECGAVMRCRKDELKYIASSDPGDQRDRPYWQMTCPHCGWGTVVDLKRSAAFDDR